MKYLFMVLVSLVLGCASGQPREIEFLRNKTKYTAYLYEPLTKQEATEIYNLLSGRLLENEYIFSLKRKNGEVEVLTTLGEPKYGKPGQAGNYYLIEKANERWIVKGPFVWAS